METSGKSARVEFGTKSSESGIERKVCDRREEEEDNNQPVAVASRQDEMPNHLSVPLKKTYPAQIRARVRDYLHDHAQDHPDLYKQDIADWETLRAPCIVHDIRNDAASPFIRSVAPLLRRPV